MVAGRAYRLQRLDPRGGTVSLHGWGLVVRRWAYSILRGDGDDLADRPLAVTDQTDDDRTSETEANRRRE